jgi:hypothetical protein
MDTSAAPGCAAPRTAAERPAGFGLTGGAGLAGFRSTMAGPAGIPQRCLA